MPSKSSRSVSSRIRRRSMISTWGVAQKAWNGSQMLEKDKRRILASWCKATPAQIRIAVELPWNALSGWMRMSLKKYFLTHPEEFAPEKGKGKAA